MYLLYIAIILHSYLSPLTHAANIPTRSILSENCPDTNKSCTKETLPCLSNHKAPIKHDTALSTTRPWLPPPFNFRSTTQPSWFLRVNSYDDPRLTFRQLHAMVSLCADAQDFLRTFDPDHPMEAKTYVFEATAREPFDLSGENVQVTFFNSAGEPGARYTASDMYIALDIMLGRMLPQELLDFGRTVLHYANMELSNGSVMKFRKVTIGRKTYERASVIAIA